VRKYRTVTAASACAFALLLGGCGGGGSSGGGGPQPTPTPTPTPTPNPSPNNTAEYQSSNSAVLANALGAYDAGATGAGVKVAVVDTGINPNLPEFTGRIDPASQDVAANRGISDDQGHGSMVSGVIAANKDSVYMHGVAYNATILSLNVYDPAGCKPGNDCFLDAAIDDAIDLAVANGAKIINMSFGDEEGMTADIWPAIQRAVDAGVVMILAAGNGGTANPNGFALQNIETNGDSGLFIIAGAMNSSRTIAAFSDRAGASAAANHYLVALGQGNATVNHLGTHVSVNGTSFATPTIAGAAALLAGTFPSLTGSEIVELLLSTADDAGSAGTDSIYGRGILNIGRAFQPQGTTTLAGSASPVSLFDNGSSSAPMGDASSTASTGAVILDGFSRAYVLDLAKTLRRPAAETPLSQALGGPQLRTSHFSNGPLAVSITLTGRPDEPRRSHTAQMWLGMEEASGAKAVAASVIQRISPKTAIALGISQSARTLHQRLTSAEENAFLVARDPLSRTGFNALAGTSLGIRHDFGAASLTVTSERGEIHHSTFREGDREGYSLQSAAIDRKLGSGRFSLGVSQLREDRTVLGARFSSAFGSGGATSTFVDASAALHLGRGWGTMASYRLGWTSLSGSSGMVDKGRLASNAFAFDLSKTNLLMTGDKFAVRFMQPLRIRNGGLAMNLPAAYDYATGETRFDQRFFSLAPRGRELDYEIAYGVGLLGGYFDVNAFIRTDPGHIEAMPTDRGAAFRFTVRQ
jgi:hypothetical protein